MTVHDRPQVFVTCFFRSFAEVKQVDAGVIQSDAGVVYLVESHPSIMPSRIGLLPYIHKASPAGNSAGLYPAKLSGRGGITLQPIITSGYRCLIASPDRDTLPGRDMLAPCPKQRQRHTDREYGGTATPYGGATWPCSWPAAAIIGLNEGIALRAKGIAAAIGHFDEPPYLIPGLS